MGNVNITLSADELLVERVREVARAQGTSLNELIRRFMESVAFPEDRRKLADEFLRLSKESNGHSGGRKWTREELYERGSPRLP